MSFVIAIDGPAGTGKGTIAKLIAEKTNFINIDTGAMYRCVALECLRKNISSTDEKRIKEILDNIDIRLEKENGTQRVFLNGEDVSKEIRSKEVDRVVAIYAALKVVRDKMTPIQRRIAMQNDVVMEGRDIGTVVFPEADVKIFLDCSLEERAKRRYKQNLEKGIETTFDEVLKDIVKRHELETTREIAPLIKAEDAILIDSTYMSIKEVVNTIENIIKEKRAGNISGGKHD